jgi:phosphate transport system protein
MTKHFFNELEILKRDVLVMGGQTEKAVARAARALLEADVAAAERVIDGDREINALEIRIEEECLKNLALYAPTAKDLRFVVGVFKITNDLERVGDLAVNIAERAKESAERHERKGREELDEMSTRVREMLNRALDAFLAQDSERARAVIALDDRVDELLRTIYQHQLDEVGQDSSHFRPAVRILSCAKYLERIADLATNIAEDVIYMATGEIVKHLH